MENVARSGVGNLPSGAAPAETQVDVLVSERRQTGAVGGSTQEGLHIRDRRGVLGVRIDKKYLRKLESEATCRLQYFSVYQSHWPKI